LRYTDPTGLENWPVIDATTIVLGVNQFAQSGFNANLANMDWAARNYNPIAWAASGIGALAWGGIDLALPDTAQDVGLWAMTGMYFVAAGPVIDASWNATTAWFKGAAGKAGNFFRRLAGKSVDDVARVAEAAGSELFPRGFASTGQYSDAMSELQAIAKGLGAKDARIGVSGSSVSGVSYDTGAPFGPTSDIDVFIESSSLTKGLATSEKMPGFVKPESFEAAHPELAAWSEKWQTILGREISVGGFQTGSLPERPTVFYGEK
jgi:hypothetical protein